MSSDVKVPAEQARAVAQQIVVSLAGICETIAIAGSVRRGKAMVGDVEIVAHPYHAPELLARLDRWIATHEAYKAVYSDGSNRWGKKYRGLKIPGFDAHVEIFLADADNWGYQYWLRTGPGEANTYVMSQCIHFNSPYRAVEGYWQIDGKKLRVTDEVDLFHLIGMPFIEPRERSLEQYQKYLNRPTWTDAYTLAEAAEVIPTQTNSLF